jgi:hypothetical protein
MPHDPALPKLTDTQAIVLSTAAQRPENIALPLPNGLAGAAAKMAVTKMIEHGWLQEVDANLRRNEPLWRETGDGHGTTLVATEAGLLAIGIEPVVAKTVAGMRGQGAQGAPSDTSSETREPVKRPAQREGTKQAKLIALLKRPSGASIADIAELTGWQAHSIRGAISGGLRRKLGLTIVSEKSETGARIYKIN